MLKKARDALAAHEGWLTCILVAVGVILLAVAVFGRTEHKIAAMVYIVL